MFTRLRPTHPRDEQGAVLVLVALLMTGLFTASAMAIDLGRVAQTKRQEQSLADIVAIDAARALEDGVSTAVIYPRVDAAARESAARNGYLLAEIDEMVVTVGKWDDITRTFEPYSPTDPVTGLKVPDAVDVRTVDQVKFLFNAGSANPARHATAIHRLAGSTCVGVCIDPPPPPPPVCVGVCAPTTTTAPSPPRVPSASSGLTIGSFLVRGTPSAPHLNALLAAYTGSPAVQGTAIGYQGLADATFTLDELRTALRFGTIQQLLDADIELSDLLLAQADILDSKASSSARVAAAELRPVARSINGRRGPVRLRNMISVSTGSEAAAAVRTMPALPIVMGSAMLANKSNLLDVDLGALAPGFDSAALKFSVVEAPKSSIGPALLGPDGKWTTAARTSQIHAQLELTIRDDELGVVSLPVYFQGAEGYGSLTRVACPVAGAYATGLSVDTSALSVSIGRAVVLADGVSSVVPARVFSLAGAAVTGSSTASIAGSYRDLDFSWSRATNETTPPQSEAVGASLPDASVGDSLGVSLSLTTALGTVPPRISNRLAPVLTRLDAVLAPLVSSLGLEIGGADVYGHAPSCTAPQLVTP